jgi:hypothetical protein
MSFPLGFSQVFCSLLASATQPVKQMRMRRVWGVARAETGCMCIGCAWLPDRDLADETSRGLGRKAGKRHRQIHPHDAQSGQSRPAQPSRNDFPSWCWDLTATFWRTPFDFRSLSPSAGLPLALVGFSTGNNNNTRYLTLGIDSARLVPATLTFRRCCIAS